MAQATGKKLWEERNREKRRPQKAAKYKANSEAARAEAKANYWATRADRSAKKKLYYLKRRDELIAAAEKWNAANPEAKRRNNRRYDAKHPEQCRVRVRTRADRLRKADGTYTAEQINQLLINQQYRCANFRCGKSLLDGYHKDHIKALAKGGSNWIGNIQLLCPPCNYAKAAKDIEDCSFTTGKQKGAASAAPPT